MGDLDRRHIWNGVCQRGAQRDTIMMQLKVAIQSLQKTPNFALAFILTLGLDIETNTTIFSIINGVLLRPLPYPNTDRLLHLRQPTVAAGIENTNFSFAKITDYRSK